MLGSIKLKNNQRQGLLNKLEADVRVDIPYLGLAIISAMIASLALLINDTAILIGAMLIAPFLTPPLAIGMGIIKGDLRLFKKGLITLAIGIAIAVSGAFLISLIYPIKEVGDEIINRSSPTLIQLAIAILAGVAGAFSYAHRKIRAVLSGAFIALALVPPISIIGIGIAFWNWEVAGGAALLLAANLIGLTIAAVAVFLLLGFRPINRPESLHEVKIGIIWLALLFFIIVIPLGYIMNNIIAGIEQEKLAEKIITQEISRYPETEIDKLFISKTGKKLKVSFDIYSPQRINVATIQGIKNRLERKLNNEIEVDAKVVPTFRINY